MLHCIVGHTCPHPAGLGVRGMASCRSILVEPWLSALRCTGGAWQLASNGCGTRMLRGIHGDQTACAPAAAVILQKGAGHPECECILDS
jgi:hypothetical protein